MNWKCDMCKDGLHNACEITSCNPEYSDCICECEKKKTEEELEIIGEQLAESIEPLLEKGIADMTICHTCGSTILDCKCKNCNCINCKKRN